MKSNDLELTDDEEILLISLRRYFSESEIELIKQKFFWKYKDIEIAKSYGISRQAVNKKVHKVIEKLQLLYRKGLIL